jgi:hypothetical protein
MDKRISKVMEQRPGDILELDRREIALEPNLFGREDDFRKFCRQFAKSLTTACDDGRQKVIEETRDEVQALAPRPAPKDALALQFACSVVVDIVAQGWKLVPRRKRIQIQSPRIEGETPDEIKRRIRAGHLLERDAQLRETSVAEFIKGMEQRRLGPSGWVSVFSVMRDGRELAGKLRTAVNAQPDDKRGEFLRATISPYLQVVETDAACPITGLKLTDIWRYFRHTWVSTYKSLPGRSMMVLVRDAAAPHHPVIGIAALGSSMAQQTLRDEWIGWDSDVFIKQIIEKPSAKWCRWVHDSVERLLNSLFQKDFLVEGILKQRELRNPTDNAIAGLLKEGTRAAEAHRFFPGAADHKSNTHGNGTGEIDWEGQATTPLFRSKRAKTLALVLGIRRNLQKAGLKDCSAASLKRALENSQARHAVRQLVRLVKAEHVGVDMMDIIICGAVPPYNRLLGGKLVCLLLASPEIVQFYRARYGEQSSIIASSMKGETVVRPPNLVLLATTSLYGVGSSQYNRVRVPLEDVGGKRGGKLEYTELGISKGYGSYHFSKASIDYLETLIPRGRDRKVNSIFGEGVNPLMRKLRDGLADVGFPAEDLLLHGNPRVVYGVPIADNFREVLLGQDAKPKYYLSLKQAEKHTALLAEFWRKRWLVGRITRPGILEDVTKHTLAYPVTHGARVSLPQDRETDLFG